MEIVETSGVELPELMDPFVRVLTREAKRAKQFYTRAGVMDLTPANNSTYTTYWERISRVSSHAC